MGRWPGRLPHSGQTRPVGAPEVTGGGSRPDEMHVCAQKNPDMLTGEEKKI